MDKTESKLITIVLKETIDRLIISNEGKFKEVKFVPKEPANIRFKEKVHESVYKELDPFQQVVEVLNEEKFQNDVNKLITLLQDTCDEMSQCCTFNKLKAVNEQFQKEVDEEIKIIDDYLEVKSQLKEITESYTNKITKYEAKMQLMDERIASIKSELKNVQRINRIELDLVKKWESTRLDQAEILTEKEEKELQDEIEIYSKKIELEKRIINDIKTYYDRLIANYKKLILFWEDKYQTEILEYWGKIKGIKKQIIAVDMKYEKHVEINLSRIQFIKEYEAKKAEEKKQFEFQQYRIKCAVRIQAWWRGTMVRRGLGPYKRKKGKSKKGKKGK